MVDEGIFGLYFEDSKTFDGSSILSAPAKCKYTPKSGVKIHEKPWK